MNLGNLNSNFTGSQRNIATEMEEQLTHDVSSNNLNEAEINFVLMQCFTVGAILIRITVLALYSVSVCAASWSEHEELLAFSWVLHVCNVVQFIFVINAYQNYCIKNAKLSWNKAYVCTLKNVKKKKYYYNNI